MAETCLSVRVRTGFSTGAFGMVRIWERPCQIQLMAHTFACTERGKEPRFAEVQKASRSNSDSDMGSNDVKAVGA